MLNKFIRHLLLLQLAIVALVFFANAQIQTDTVKLSINQVEDSFLKNNLQLIIQHYNIDNAQAQVITARLFPNPDFNVSTTLYNPTTKKYFDYSGGQDEYAGGFSQLFTTAGKRNKSIRLAKIGVEQAKYQFFDLLRTLKFTLRNDFFSIYFQQQSEKVYNLEITSLADILSAYKIQYAKGNIAQKELLRIQSQLYSLQAELTNLQVGVDTTERQLKLLTRLNLNTYIEPQFNYNLIDKETLESIPYQKLLDSAYNNRFDLKLSRLTVEYNNLNLKLQKASAIPDITFSLGFDKRGSFVVNYNYLGLSLPIPIFNLNQGAIKQAKIAIDQSKFQLLNYQQLIESDISINYKVAGKYEKVYNDFDPQFRADFTHLIQEVSKNYAKKNISLLSFLDFYESYRLNAILLNNIQLNRITSLEQLNFVTGTPFFNQQ